LILLLAFLLPFSIYLLILGSINRRRTPVMVSGVSDFIGVLFAASGFLLVGGPAILSSLNERWRMFWLLGERPADSENFWQFWMLLSVAYFAVVVGGAALVFRGQRHLTSVYNTDPELVQRCLVEVCEQMGLDPVQSGNLFVFGVEPATRPIAAGGDAIQAESAPEPAAPTKTLLQQTAVLELEAFTRMRHVTLRWDPAQTALRREVEAALEKVLDETLVEPSEVGVWLTLLGVTLFGATLITGVTLIVVRMFA
jgi:hypothetical protein